VGAQPDGSRERGELTATVTPLRERQLIREGDRVLGVLEILERGFCDLLGTVPGLTDTAETQAEVHARVEEIRQQWRQLAYGAQAEDGEAA
jgi:hypothetical protein